MICMTAIVLEAAPKLLASIALEIEGSDQPYKSIL
jgi:hypothetical protein